MGFFCIESHIWVRYCFEGGGSKVAEWISGYRSVGSGFDSQTDTQMDIWVFNDSVRHVTTFLAKWLKTFVANYPPLTSIRTHKNRITPYNMSPPGKNVIRKE